MARPSLRDALLDAGADVLGIAGYTATGVAAIAAAAGAPKGSFYNHFPSKEALAVEVLNRYGQGRRLDLLDETGVPAVQRIRNHLQHLKTDLAAHDYRRGCMFGNFAAESPDTAPELSAAVAAALDNWRRALARAIRDGQGHGEIPDFDADAAAAMIVDSWEGAALRAKLADSGHPIENVMELVFGRILGVT